MSRSANDARVATTLPLFLFAVWSIVTPTLLLLAWSNRHLHYIDPDGRTTFTVEMGFFAVEAAMSLVYAIVGTLVVARTRHIIGWLLLAIAIAFPALGLTEQYALHGLVASPGSLPATTPVGLATLVVAGVTTTSITLTLLLFPTGAPRSPRWRWAVRATFVAAGLWVISYGLTPGPVSGPWNDYGVHIRNPLGVEALTHVLKATFAVGVAASLILSVAGVVCLVLRFRGSRGVERQQVKFLAYVGVLIFVLFVVQFVVGLVLRVAEEISNVTWSIFFVTLMVGIPVSVGAAILRYRLFDIDRIISRTFSYAIVTAVLGGTFALLVLVPTAVLGSGAATPDWLIAVATLVIASLFRPLRARVQSIVDRRFDRARYDAARTIDAFSTRLRQQIDLDALVVELESVVDRTMRPAHLSVWLHEHARAR